jgi:hypothetical protein
MPGRRCRAPASSLQADASLGGGVLASSEWARRWRCMAEPRFGDAARRPRAAELGMQGNSWLWASLAYGQCVLA